MHNCVSNPTIICSDNGRQAIIYANVGLLLIGTLGTNFRESWSKSIHFHSRKRIWKCRLEMPANLYRPHCVKATRNSWPRRRWIKWSKYILSLITTLLPWQCNGITAPFMMTSSKGNSFPVISPLWGESAVHRGALWCLWSTLEQTVKQTIEKQVIWDAITPIMTPV